MSVRRNKRSSFSPLQFMRERILKTPLRNDATQTTASPSTTNLSPTPFGLSTSKKAQRSNSKRQRPRSPIAASTTTSSPEETMIRLDSVLGGPKGSYFLLDGKMMTKNMNLKNLLRSSLHFVDLSLIEIVEVDLPLGPGRSRQQGYFAHIGTTFDYSNVRKSVCPPFKESDFYYGLKSVRNKTRCLYKDRDAAVNGFLFSLLMDRRHSTQLHDFIAWVKRSVQNVEMMCVNFCILPEKNNQSFQVSWDENGTSIIIEDQYISV